MYSRGTADALIRRTNDEKPLQKTVYHAAGRNDLKKHWTLKIKGSGFLCRMRKSSIYAPPKKISDPKEHKYPIADRSNIRISDY